MGSIPASNTPQNSGSLKMSRSSCIADNSTIDHTSINNRTFIRRRPELSAHSLIRGHDSEFFRLIQLGSRYDVPSNFLFQKQKKARPVVLEPGCQIAQISGLQELACVVEMMVRGLWRDTRRPSKHLPHAIHPKRAPIDPARWGLSRLRSQTISTAGSLPGPAKLGLPSRRRMLRGTIPLTTKKTSRPAPCEITTVASWSGNCWRVRISSLTFISKSTT